MNPLHSKTGGLTFFRMASARAFSGLLVHLTTSGDAEIHRHGSWNYSQNGKKRQKLGICEDHDRNTYTWGRSTNSTTNCNATWVESIGTLFYLLIRSRTCCIQECLDCLNEDMKGRKCYIVDKTNHFTSIHSIPARLTSTELQWEDMRSTNASPDSCSALSTTKEQHIFHGCVETAPGL